MTGDRERCEERDKPWPLPPSFTIAAARLHPRYRHYLEPGARCELEADHAGPHRAGQLIWHTTPVVLIAGEVREPPTGPWMLLGELVHPDAQ